MDISIFFDDDLLRVAKLGRSTSCASESRTRRSRGWGMKLDHFIEMRPDSGLGLNK